MQREARDLLAAGPRPLTPDEVDALRYALSADLDDLADASNPSERFAVMAQVFRLSAELLLQLDRIWLGHGKWLMRQLATADDPLANRLLGWAASSGNRNELGAIARDVLDRAGGYLQEGFLRGTKPG